uniref:Uncharacterized protein n=1 Tax=Mycena chlorophos TaxID=658473 RepID=A0ABQ0LB39_MYCCL|nr:predicted protein [Mycena chlorophos]
MIRRFSFSSIFSKEDRDSAGGARSEATQPLPPLVHPFHDAQSVVSMSLEGETLIDDDPFADLSTGALPVKAPAEAISLTALIEADKVVVSQVPRGHVGAGLPAEPWNDGPVITPPVMMTTRPFPAMQQTPFPQSKDLDESPFEDDDEDVDELDDLDLNDLGINFESQKEFEPAVSRRLSKQLSPATPAKGNTKPPVVQSGPLRKKAMLPPLDTSRQRIRPRALTSVATSGSRFRSSTLVGDTLHFAPTSPHQASATVMLSPPWDPPPLTRDTSEDDTGSSVSSHSESYHWKTKDLFHLPPPPTPLDTSPGKHSLNPISILLPRPRLISDASVIAVDSDKVSLAPSTRTLGKMRRIKSQFGLLRRIPSAAVLASS